MKCTIKFSDNIYVTVEAEDIRSAVAIARVELIKRRDKNWNIYDVLAFKWDNKFDE